MATVCTKPSAADMPQIWAPLNASIKAVTGIRKPKDRKDPANLFLDAINGGIGALAFAAVESKSWETVQQNTDSFRYVADKILMTYRKEGPELYVSWEKSYQELLMALKDIAQNHHPTGLKWQLSGPSHKEYVPGQVASVGPVMAMGAVGLTPATAESPGAGDGPSGAWMAITDGPLASYIKMSNEVGDEVQEMCGHFASGFAEVDSLLKMAEACKKPADLGSVLSGLQTQLRATTSVKMPKRSSPLDLHYKIMKTAVNCLAFVAVDNKSWETVQNTIEEMDFNGNKLLSEFRKSGPQLYVDWLGQLKTVLTAVRDFAKAHAPCGLKWNMSGTDTSEYTLAKVDPRAAKPAAPSGGGKGKGGRGAPTAEQLAARERIKQRQEEEKKQEEARRAEHGAPPPVDYSKTSEPSPMELMMAELEDRAKGGASAKGDLKKVDKHDKSWQTNRVVVDSSKKKAPASGGWGARAKTRFPLKEGYEGADLYRLAYLYGTRDSKARRTIVVENPRRDAITIMECEDVDIEVKGVVKNISIAGCKRYRISMEGSIGQVEVSNSESGYLTIGGRIYQMTCDKCVGLEATLCPDAYQAKIVSSQCSSLNIGLDNPDKSNSDLGFLSLPVPSQYESTLLIEGTRVQLVTEAVNHNFG